MKPFAEWLAQRGVPEDAIETLVMLTEINGLFETRQRIMEPDVWFYFPGNYRFILLASCPNGDAVALDTVDFPGAVFYIDHERVHDDVPDAERVICVADSIEEYIHSSLDPGFPCEYREAKGRCF